MHNRSGNQHKWRPAHKNEQRLQFPIQQQNSSFRKHGRKHYAFMYNKSDKYLFNPQSININHQYSDQLSNHNLQHNSPRNYNHNHNERVTPPFIIRRKENYSQRNMKMGEQEDSLILYQKQFQSKTLQRQKLPNIRNEISINSGMQYEYDNNIQINKYFNEPINKKAALKNHTVPQQSTKQSNLQYLYGNINSNANTNTNSSPTPKLPSNNVNSINYYNPSPSPSPSLYPSQQAMTPRRRLVKDESNLKIFGTVQNLYDIVHAGDGTNSTNPNPNSNSKDKDKDIPYYLHPHNQKIVNPNFIYSPFRAA